MNIAKSSMIRRLDPKCASLLRSGIAITSLAQCVEELILNAIDAGATLVDVRLDLTRFGARVSDNGVGVSREDLKVLGERHATSKCASISDLETGISTHGYRGEALASICDIATLEINTRRRVEDGGDGATYMKIMSPGVAAHHISRCLQDRPSTGTTVVVHDLFRGLPVRRQLLDPGKEVERCRRAVESITLGNPHVAVTLRSDASRADSQPIIATRRCKSQAAVFADLFGHQRASLLRAVDGSSVRFNVSGWISLETASTKSLQYVFVNGRLSLNTPIHRAVADALGASTLIRPTVVQAGGLGDPQQGQADSNPTKGRNAIFVINVQCAQREVDASFEPSKTIITFRHWDELLATTKQAVKNFVDTNGLAAPSLYAQLVANTGARGSQPSQASPAEFASTRSDTHSQSLFSDQEEIVSGLSLRPPAPAEDYSSSNRRILHSETVRRFTANEDEADPKEINAVRTSSQTLDDAMPTACYASRMADTDHTVAHETRAPTSILFGENEVTEQCASVGLPDSSPVHRSADRRNTDNNGDSVDCAFDTAYNVTTEARPVAPFVSATDFDHSIARPSIQGVESHSIIGEFPQFSSSGDPLSIDIRPQQPTGNANSTDNDFAGIPTSDDGFASSRCRLGSETPWTDRSERSGGIAGDTVFGGGVATPVFRRRPLSAHEEANYQSPVQFMGPSSTTDNGRDSFSDFRGSFSDSPRFRPPRVETSTAEGAQFGIRASVSRDSSFQDGEALLTSAALPSHKSSEALPTQSLLSLRLDSFPAPRLRIPNARNEPTTPVSRTVQELPCAPSPSLLRLCLLSERVDDARRLPSGTRSVGAVATVVPATAVDFSAPNDASPGTQLPSSLNSCEDVAPSSVADSPFDRTVTRQPMALRMTTLGSKALSLTDAGENSLDGLHGLDSAADDIGDIHDDAALFEQHPCSNTSGESFEAEQQKDVGLESGAASANSAPSDGVEADRGKRKLNDYVDGSAPFKRARVERDCVSAGAPPCDSHCEHGPVVHSGGLACVQPAEESQWDAFFDESIGRLVYVHKMSGNTSFEPPRTPSSEGFVGGSEDGASCVMSADRPFLGTAPHLGAFVDRSDTTHLKAEGRRITMRGPLDNDGDTAECTIAGNSTLDSSVTTLLSEWQNPALTSDSVAIPSVAATATDAGGFRPLVPYRFSRDMLSTLSVIGQVDNKFIACLMDRPSEQTSDISTDTIPDRKRVLVLIDQHAAHERVRLELYEDEVKKFALSYDETQQSERECFSNAESDGHLRTSLSDTLVRGTQLRVPVLVTLTKAEARLVAENGAALFRWGIELSLPANIFTNADTHSGHVTAHVTHVPPSIVDRVGADASVVSGIVREQLQIAEEGGRGACGGVMPRSLHAVLQSKACHGAIRFGDRLTLDECRTLVRELTLCRLPFQCAHGRPSVAPLADIDGLAAVVALMAGQFG